MIEQSNQIPKTVGIDRDTATKKPRSSQQPRAITVTFAQPLPAPRSESKDFFKTNATLMAWLLFLCFGGSLLSLYYAHIGYLPEFEWKSALIYLGIASIIGGAVALLLSLSLLIPGLIWDVFLICDPLLTGVFCYQEHGRRDPSLGDVFLKLGLPFGIVLGISHSVLTLGTGVYVVVALISLSLCLLIMYFLFNHMVVGGRMAEKQKHKEKSDSKNGGVSNTLVVSGDAKKLELTEGDHQKGAPSTFSVGRGKKKLRRAKGDDHKRALRFTFWFGLSVFVGQVSLLITYLLSGSPRDEGFWIVAAICTFTVLLSNHVVALLYAHHRWEAVLASAVTALLLLVIANHYSSLPAGIMSLYGFGDSQKVTVYVNEQGENLLKSMQLSEHSCFDGQPAKNKLCGVEILSALGNSYYLEWKELLSRCRKRWLLLESVSRRHLNNFGLRTIDDYFQGFIRN